MPTAPLKVRNWDKWQNYRKDRSAPPWIKLYVRLLIDPAWNQLTDAHKGHLISLWILAADRNGCIPDDAKLLRKLAGLDSTPPIERFVSLGFFERPMTTKNENDVRLDTDTETDTEKKNTIVGLNGRRREALEVLNFLNTKTGKNYRPVAVNLDMIAARLKEGATVQECKAVIVRRCRAWENDEKMAKYLRPATIFNREKFAQYMGELPNV